MQTVVTDFLVLFRRPICFVIEITRADDATQYDITLYDSSARGRFAAASLGISF